MHVISKYYSIRLSIDDDLKIGISIHSLKHKKSKFICFITDSNLEDAIKNISPDFFLESDDASANIPINDVLKMQMWEYKNTLYGFYCAMEKNKDMLANISWQMISYVEIFSADMMVFINSLADIEKENPKVEDSYYSELLDAKDFYYRWKYLFDIKTNALDRQV